MKVVIAIDGPAGAGKSTVSKILARDLGLRYLDTGAMYRALAYKARGLEMDGADGEEIAVLMEMTTIEFGEGDPQPVLLDGFAGKVDDRARAFHGIGRYGVLFAIPTIEANRVRLGLTAAEHDQVVTLGNQLFDKRTPDHAGGAGEYDLHARAFCC